MRPVTMKGISSELLKLLVEIGHKESLHWITGHISPGNTTMETVSEQVELQTAFRSRGQ